MNEIVYERRRTPSMWDRLIGLYKFSGGKDFSFLKDGLGKIIDLRNAFVHPDSSTLRKEDAKTIYLPEGVKLFVSTVIKFIKDIF